jgi:hypothetical protein
MDSDDVRKVMAAVAVYWPNVVLYPPGHADLAVEMWLRALRDLSLSAALTAVELLRDEPDRRAFAPTVGAIRARTIEMLADAGGTNVPSGPDAWAEVQDRIARVGYVGTPSWTHPVIAAAVRSIGWQALCHSDADNGVMFAHFRDVYATYVRRAQREQVMAPDVRVVIDGLAARLELP